MELFLGLGVGVLFGFLLQKSEVLRFEKQVGFLLLKDMTIIKFMLSAILVGMVGIYLLNDAGIISLKLKETFVAAQLIGGIVFGGGWALLGYCPGTSVGALAEGRLHALWGILGMLCGAALYARLYPWAKEVIISAGDMGKITLSEVLNLPPLTVVIGMSVILVVVLIGVRNK